MDALDSRYEYVTGNPDSEMNLIDIYPFVSALDSDKLDIIYLGSWERFKNTDVYPKNIICVGGGQNARTLFEEHRLTGLIYPEDCDALTILREIQEVFTKYYKLERELLDTLLANAPLHAILNACACFLECHMMLFGTGFSLLGYSDNYLPSDENVIWKETLMMRRSVLPMIPRDKVKMLPNKPKDFPRSTFLDISGIPPHLNIAFDSGDSRVATLIFQQHIKPIMQQHLWLADYIADIIRPLIMERYNTFFDMRNYFRTSVSTALRYATTDTTFLLTCLARFGWHADDDYQIILVQLPHENCKISHYLYNYENVFAGSYSDIIALRHDIYIFILLHNGACSILNQYLPTLKKQLDMDDGVCGIGQQFCDFTQLKLQYDLAILPFRNAHHKQRRVYYYSEIMEEHIINELSSCFPLRATCHHAAVRINEYDNANGSDYLLTLETYLKNNKSLMAASDILSIHRSTLTYRLKCIEKIVPMQLEDPNERLHILLSCISMRVLNSDTPPLVP